MDAQTVIAKRIARELRPGMLVNLGIGIPTLVANYVAAGVTVFFQSENGANRHRTDPRRGNGPSDPHRCWRKAGQRTTRRLHVR